MGEEPKGGIRKPPLGAQAAEEFLHLFQRGVEFLREVVAENEKLRYRITVLEEQLKELENKNTSREVEEWKRKYEDLLRQLDAIRVENENVMKKFIEIEEENNSLANLYIASYQLHTTLNFQEVLQIVMEIVINLVGAHSFAIYLVEPQEGHLRPAMAEGVDLASLKPLPLEGSVAGKAVRTGELYVNDSLLISGGSPENPIVVVPLLIKGEPIGAVILFKMLPQKKKFAEVDRELFNLLAGHAATALFASKLYTETERKRRTMQGFIDLLTR